MRFYFTAEGDDASTLCIEGESNEDEIELKARLTPFSTFSAEIPLYDHELASLKEIIDARLGRGD